MIYIKDLYLKKSMKSLEINTVFSGDGEVSRHEFDHFYTQVKQLKRYYVTLIFYIFKTFKGQ